jgi:hypothetical protein
MKVLAGPVLPVSQSFDTIEGDVKSFLAIDINDEEYPFYFLAIPLASVEDIAIAHDDLVHFSHKWPANEAEEKPAEIGD